VVKIVFTVYSVLINLTQLSEDRVREGTVRLARVVLSALCCTPAFNERWTRCPELAAYKFIYVPRCCSAKVTSYSWS
jgi:hypothetical protein